MELSWPTGAIFVNSITRVVRGSEAGLKPNSGYCRGCLGFQCILGSEVNRVVWADGGMTCQDLQVSQWSGFWRRIV